METGKTTTKIMKHKTIQEFSIQLHTYIQTQLYKIKIIMKTTTKSAVNAIKIYI